VQAPAQAAPPQVPVLAQVALPQVPVRARAQVQAQVLAPALALAQVLAQAPELAQEPVQVLVQEQVSVPAPVLVPALVRVLAQVQVQAARALDMKVLDHLDRAMAPVLVLVQVQVLALHLHQQGLRLHPQLLCVWQLLLLEAWRHPTSVSLRSHHFPSSLPSIEACTCHLTLLLYVALERVDIERSRTVVCPSLVFLRVSSQYLPKGNTSHHIEAHQCRKLAPAREHTRSGR